MNTFKKFITMFICCIMVTVMFSETRMFSASAAYFPASGIYYTFTNVASNKMLNVQGSYSWSGANVTIFPEDNTTGQLFKMIAHGTKYYNGKKYTKYIIEPKCAPTCALNVYGSYSSPGFNVNIWTKSGNDTQDWIFQEVMPGCYFIRSANNPNCVLTETGTYNMANVNLRADNASGSGTNPYIWHAIHRTCYPA